MKHECTLFEKLLLFSPNVTELPSITTAFMNVSGRIRGVALRHASRSRRRATNTNIRALTSSSVPAMSNSSLPSKQIDFSVSAKIEGEESQIATVKLSPGETLRAESGAMLFMTQGVEMSTDLHGASAAFSRMMTGQNVFLTDFTYKGDKGEGTIGLGTDFPSKIVRLSLQDYQDSTLICQRGAYLASNPSVDIEMAYTKSLSAGFFGGQGFILQKLSGQGDVLVKAGGALVEKDLEDGETLRVTSGSIVGFTSTIDYDIQMMPGIKNAMFGGEGLFVATLKGPGKVWLQGMPPDRMIAEIARRVPRGGIGPFIPIGGSAGGDASADGDSEPVEEASDESSEELVAASDAAVDADRQATVASSGMMDADADSPSALYGDAAPSNSTGSSGRDDFFGESTFNADEKSFGEEPVFSDETSFSTESDFDQHSQGDFFGDDTQTTTDVFDSGATAVGGGEEGGSGILGTLWDLFMGDD